MLPLVLIAAASAAAQYYQAEKARGANAKVLAGLKADFDRLIPPKYNLSVMDPPEYIKQAIPAPSFDMKDITPEQFKLVGKYKPEIAPMIAEQRPELAKESASAKEGRQAQLNALRQMKRMSSEQGDPELQQAIYGAGRQAQQQAQSRQASILQDMAQRGMLGAGAGLAASLQGSSDSMQRASDASRQAAVESYRNRIQALRDSASLGGQIRGDDMAQANREADIINSFNERTSRNRQNWEAQRANALNSAQQFNLGNEQAIANQNVEQRNRAALSNRDRRDALTKYGYENKLRDRDYQNSVAEQQAKWRQGERDNQNSLASQQFNDQYRITAGRQGLGSMQMGMNTQNAADKNAAIQGIASAASSGYNAYQDKQERDAELERRKRYGEY